MKRTFAVAVAFFVASAVAATGAAQNGFVVVGNSSTTPDAMSKRDLIKIFLKYKTTWPDGQQAEPVDQKRSSETRVEFSQGVLDRSVDTVESHWQAQVFTGKGVPPKTVSSDFAVIEYVRTHPGAVGYVSRGTDTSLVKVIRVVE